MLLRRGSQGSEVEALQQQLAEAGYDVGIDGVFGPETQRAVREFQKDNGLSVDGVAGNNTFGALKDITTQTAANIDAAPSANVNAAPSEAQAEPYVVQQGDTLSSIAERELGDKSRFREIAQANGIANPNAIGIGQKLVIPGQTAAPSAAPALPVEAQAAALAAGAAITGEDAASTEPERFVAPSFLKAETGRDERGQGVSEIDFESNGPNGGVFGSLRNQINFAGEENAVEGGGWVRPEGSNLSYGGALRYSDVDGALAAGALSHFSGEFDNNRLTFAASVAEEGGVGVAGAFNTFGQTANDGTYNLSFKAAHNPDGGVTAVPDGNRFFYTDSQVETLLSASGEYDGPNGFNTEGFLQFRDSGDSGETQDIFASGQASKRGVLGQENLTLGGFANHFSETTGFSTTTYGVGARYDNPFDTNRTSLYGAVGQNLDGDVGALGGVEFGLGPNTQAQGYVSAGHNVNSVAPGTGAIPTFAVDPNAGPVIGAGIKIPVSIFGGSEARKEAIDGPTPAPTPESEKGRILMRF